MENKIEKLQKQFETDPKCNQPELMCQIAEAYLAQGEKFAKEAIEFYKQAAFWSDRVCNFYRDTEYETRAQACSDKVRSASKK